MCESQETRYTLLQRAIQNDEEAWREIQEHYQKFIYFFLHKLRVREADLDDIAQEVMIALSTKLSSYDREKGAFRTWLRTVVRNHTLMFFRRESTRSKYTERFQAESVLFNEESSDEFDKQFDTEWEQHVIKIAMDKIKGSFSENAEKVVNLELQGYDVNEIAEKLNMNTSAVYKMRTRIKKSLILQIQEVVRDLES